MTTLTIQADTLKSLFEAVKPAIHRTSPLPIATHVRIKAVEGQLSLQSTDGALYMTATADQDTGDEQCDFCVPPDKLQIALATCSGQITVEIDPGFVTFKQGRSRLKAVTMPGDMFPQPIATTFTASYTITGLGAAIEQALFCVDPANVRKHMQGVWLDSKADRLALIGAGSGSVMAVQTMQGDFEPRTLMMPHGAAKLASRFGEATVNLASDRVRIESAGVALEFPPAAVPALPWEKAIPKTDARFSVAKQPLINAISHCLTFKAADKLTYVIFEFDGELLTIKTDRPGEEFFTQIEAAGDPFTTAFHPRQLLDGLQHAAGEDITLSWLNTSEPHLSARLMTVGSWRFVIMPLKL